MRDGSGRPDYIEEDRGHDTPCWIWQGAVDRRGHGHILRDGYHGQAHRWFYMQALGAVPNGAVLDHLCGVRACVNPAHLEPVTQAENVRRSPLAKLTEGQAHEIRRLAEEGVLTQPEIGAMFGVGQQAVSLIKTRKRWSTPGGSLVAA